MWGGTADGERKRDTERRKPARWGYVAYRMNREAGEVEAINTKHIFTRIGRCPDNNKGVAIVVFAIHITCDKDPGALCEFRRRNGIVRFGEHIVASAPGCREVDGGLNFLLAPTNKGGALGHTMYAESAKAGGHARCSQGVVAWRTGSAKDRCGVIGGRWWPKAGGGWCSCSYSW